jgi:hypothetical protein
VSFLVFVSRPTGYELRERDGDPPAVGTDIELDDFRVRVVKIGPSPLPGDDRPCAFTQPA